MYGVEYLFEHIVNEKRKEERKRSYEYYVTDVLAGILNCWNEHGVSRFYDLVNAKTETRSAEEIINNIKEKLEQSE